MGRAVDTGAVLAQRRPVHRIRTRRRVTQGALILLIVAGVASHTAAQDAGVAAAAAATVAPTDGGTYAIELRDLQRHVDELAARPTRPIASPRIAAGNARLTLVHENRMSAAFRLESVTYLLDGAKIYDASDASDALASRTEMTVFDGAIAPGAHTLVVRLVFRGNGAGVFSYLRRYRFRVRARPHTFDVAVGTHATLRIVSYERAGTTTPLEERPAIRFIERTAPN
jgi:hypothetical protein